MHTSAFISQLKTVLPEPSLPWVSSALLHDHNIWGCLQMPELNEKLFKQDGKVLETWSPANIALTALQGDPNPDFLSPNRLQQDLQYPVETGLRRRAAHAFEAFTSRQASGSSAHLVQLEDALFQVTQSALLALALRERRRLLGSWDGLSSELLRSSVAAQGEFGLLHNVDFTSCVTHPSGSFDPQVDLANQVEMISRWGTPLACLYGMIPDQLELLRALLSSGVAAGQQNLVLHILLSNPVTPEKLVDQVRALLSYLSLSDGVALLTGLYTHRPEMTSSLAQDLINLRCGQCMGLEHPQPAVPQQAEPVDFLHMINRQIFEARAHRLAKQALPALAHINAAWEASYRLQACLASQQAQILEQSGDKELSLPAWKQAVELAPGTIDYVSAQVRTLVNAGQAEEAAALISTTTTDEDVVHPGLKLTSASLAVRRGDLETARHYAVEALSSIEKDPGSANPSDLLTLGRLFIDLDAPVEASRAARIALASQPAGQEYLALLSKAQFSLGRLEEAAQSAQIAAAVNPEVIDIRRQLASSLEAANEWTQALPERCAVIELSGENLDMQDLHAMAICALLAGEASQAASACRRAIDLNSEDGEAHSMLGQALRLMGDPQGAQEHLFVATQFAPELPEPWLALAEIQKEAGTSLKALDTLRAGALASPTSPKIFLAIGEAYLEDWEGRGIPALTQALAMLQNASTLSARTSPELSAKIGLRLGETLQILGHTSDARHVLGAAYQENPDFPGLAETYASTLLASNDYSAALPVLRRIVDLQPDNPSANLDLARALIALQKTPDEAIRCLDFVLTTDHYTSEGQALLAEALALAGDYSSSLQAYQAVMESDLVADPAWCSRLSLGLGRTALALNQPETAIAALEEAAQADPQNHIISRNLCSAYLTAGLESDALQAARLALRLAPDDIENLTWFAETVIQMPSGDTAVVKDEALNAFSRALALAPGKPGLLLRHGKVQLLAGESSAATATFKMLASEEKASVEELRQSALYLLDLGDAPGAVACLEKALHLSGSSAYDASGPDGIPLALINAYNRTSNPQAALAVLEQTLDRSPADPALLKLKADLLVELGRPSDALSCVREAIDLDKDSQWIPELHLQAAGISRRMGNLTDALKHVEAVLAKEDPTLPGSHHLAARALAASLARAVLQPDRSSAFLGASPDVPESDDKMVSLPGWIEYHCLRAELALDAGDSIIASQSLEAAARYIDNSASRSRLQAIRSRLEIARGEHEAAIFSLNQALTQAGEAGVNNSASDLISLSRAALDLAQWDPAVFLARQAVDAAPAEPYIHICLANALLLRAEAQDLAQAVNMTVHAPGASANSDHSRGLFEAALDKASACLSDSTSQPYLARLRARGLVVFTPGPSAIQSLASISVYPLDPEDTAAQIAILRSSYHPTIDSPIAVTSASPATLAMQASRSFPQHPLVLAQLAATLKATGQHTSDAFSAALEASRCLSSGEKEGKAWVIPALGEQPAATMSALAAAAAFGAGDFEAALLSIEHALSIYPEEPHWHSLASQVHSQRRDYDEAVEHMEQACRLEPNNYQHFLGLGSALLAVPVEDQELSERAINAFEKAAELAPDSTHAWMLLAEAYCKAGLITKASGCCERAITLTPANPAPLVLKAEIALQAGDAQEAYNRLESAMSLPSEASAQADPNMILLLARTLDQLNRPGEALTALEKALEEVSEPLPLLLERVHLIRRSQGWPAAIEAMREMTDKYPEEPVVLAYLAKGYAETNANEAAIASAQHALQSCSNPEVLLVLDTNEQARMHLLLGKLLRQSGQLDQSLHHLNEANLKDPRLLEPYLELGRVFQERRQMNQALQIYNRATTVAPRDPRPYFQAGLALKESKDYIGAEAMLRRAASLAPNDLGIHRQLGAVVALNLVHNRRRSALDV